MRTVKTAFVWALTAAVAASGATIRVPEDAPTIPDAVELAASGDTILVNDPYLFNLQVLNYQGKAIWIESVASAEQPYDALWIMAPDSGLRTSQWGSCRIYGELRSGVTGTTDVYAGSFELEYNSRLVVKPTAQMSITTSVVYLLGDTTVGANAGLTFSVDGGIVDQDGSLTLSEGSRLDVNCPYRVGASITGRDAVFAATESIDVQYGDWVMHGGRIEADPDFSIDSNNSVLLLGSQLSVFDECDVDGTLRVDEGLVIVRVLNGYGEVDLFDTEVWAEMLTNSAELRGSGYWVSDLDNWGAFDCVDDVTLVGDLHNGGIITVYAGTLTVMGEFTNDGTLIGNLDDEPGGARIGGDFNAGPDGGLSMPEAGSVRVDGDFDVAINDHAAYNMVGSTLILGSLAGADVTAEVMSRDTGPNSAGLQPTPGNFPIGTVRIAGATVTLVDDHDNDGLGEEPHEALYVDTLEIAAGATLNTGPYHVYYQTLINDGTVSNPENLMQITGNPLGDLNCDGVLNAFDIDPFARALSDPTGYAEAFPDCDRMLADCNADGELNAFDIDPFVQLVSGG